MFRNVVAALNESLDITMHLKPLTEHFEVSVDDTLVLTIPQAIDSAEFPDTRPLFSPLMHTVTTTQIFSKL